MNEMSWQAHVHTGYQVHELLAKSTTEGNLYSSLDQMMDKHSRKEDIPYRKLPIFEIFHTGGQRVLITRKTVCEDPEAEITTAERKKMKVIDIA